MAASFTLELDTTGPVIAAYAPVYATPQVDIEITIESNEPLAEYQEIYAIDSVGNRHDFIFKHEDDAYFGIVDASMFAIGIATIYVRLMDEVSNLSDTKMVSIEVKEAVEINVYAIERIRDITSHESVRLINSQELFRTADSTEIIRNVLSNEITRLVFTTDRSREIEVIEEWNINQETQSD